MSLKFLFTWCPNVCFTISKNFLLKFYYLQGFEIYSVHKILKEFGAFIS